MSSQGETGQTDTKSIFEKLLGSVSRPKADANHFTDLGSVRLIKAIKKEEQT